MNQLGAAIKIDNFNFSLHNAIVFFGLCKKCDTKNDHSIYNVLCTCSMFIYDCVERGIQIASPFWSSDSTKLTSTIAYVMPILGAITGGLYCLYLVYLVVTVLFNLIKRQRLGYWILLSTINRHNTVSFLTQVYNLWRSYKQIEYPMNSQFVGRLKHEDLIFRFQVVISVVKSCWK